MLFRPLTLRVAGSFSGVPCLRADCSCSGLQPSTSVVGSGTPELCRSRNATNTQPAHSAIRLHFVPAGCTSGSTSLSTLIHIIKRFLITWPSQQPFILHPGFSFPQKALHGATPSWLFLKWLLRFKRIHGEKNTLMFPPHHHIFQTQIGQPISFT